MRERRAREVRWWPLVVGLGALAALVVCVLAWLNETPEVGARSETSLASVGAASGSGEPRSASSTRAHEHERSPWARRSVSWGRAWVGVRRWVGQRWGGVEGRLRARVAGWAPRRPSVVLITVDSLRADHLGVYGYDRPTSPRIDEWARGAVVFEQARTVGPMTRYSVAPTLAGRYFTELRRSAPEQWPRIHADEVMLAERFAAAGYHTAAVQSIDYFHPMNGMAQGFEHFDISCFSTSGCRGFRKSATSRHVTDRALAHMEGVDGPFFLWVYYSDPHTELKRHPELRGVLPSETRVDYYDQEVRHTDTHIGRLLDGLKASGKLRETIVVLMADHGEALEPGEEHGQGHHGLNIYDEVMHIPLIIRSPWEKPGRVGGVAVSLMDVTPTLMALIGEAPDPILRGVSLAPYLSGERPARPPVFMEKERSEEDIWPTGRRLRGMVDWPYKVIWTPKRGRFAIYDLEADPRERRDLMKGDRLDEATKGRLIEQLTEWSEGLPRRGLEAR